MAKKSTRQAASSNASRKRTRPDKPAARRTRRKQTAAADSQPKSKRGVPVVGIGASAGGLDAFNKLFEAMPADSGAAFVLVQHLDPTHKSLTANLLATHTTMPVVEAQDGIQIEANHIYTIPTNTNLAFDKGRLHLSELTERRGVRAPIDFFFASLAQGLREKAIGIVLSGAGSDGSRGLKEIGANDGMTMAQAPETAQHDAMPKSAIATGCVDYVLPIEAMPGPLITYLRHSYTNGGAQSPPKTKTVAVTNGFKSILELLRERTGYPLDHYKKGTLLRRMARRMGLVHIEKHARYLEMLREDQAEVGALVKDLFIGVTEFFRDPPAWEALEQEVIKPLVAREDRGAPIRVWVPGCASGEEAYSIAMVLLEQLDLARQNRKLQVFASDINETSLEFARAGIYPGNIAPNVGRERLRQFFTALDDGRHYQVGKRLREALVFALQNLLSDPPFSKLDLIVCRNLLIYLEPAAQQKLIPLFHFALNERGALFLGNAETIGRHNDLFQTIDKKWRIFKRSGSAGYQRAYRHELSGERTPVAKELRASESVSRGAALAQRELLERFAPAAVLIDHDYNLLYFWGATDDYLVQPAGAPTPNLLAQLRQGMRNKVKTAVEQARRDDKTQIAEVRIKRGNAVPKVTVTVTAVRAPDRTGNLLVTFEDQPETVVTEPRELDAGDSMARQLEAELKVAREDLQSSIEQFEVSNEELMAANEEVTSINEELQATNEELETSKEELQSVNEELTTVNSQLHEKLTEVETINADLKNLMDSADIATIFLDRQFRITRFTPATSELLPLVTTDVGRAITIFARQFDVNLLRDADQVLEKIVTIEAEVKTDDGQWYQRRLMPYHTADHHIGGVVVTYSNITALKKEQQLASDALEALRSVNAELDRRVVERTAVAERRAAELRNLASELSFAEERERRKLATDLHEGLSQSLALINVRLANLRPSLKRNKDAQREVQAIAGLLSQANDSVRTHIFDLSPPVLEDFGLVKALEWLAEDLRKTHGLAVDVQGQSELGQLDERIRLTLFRATRELLINVVKHAGIDHATVILESGEQDIVVTVQDDGKGFDPAQVSRGRASGFGLFSIFERLSYLGGEMTTESAQGNGAKIVLRAPLGLTDRQ